MLSNSQSLRIRSCMQIRNRCEFETETPMKAAFLALYATFFPWPHIQYGWKPASSPRALPPPSPAAFDAEPTFLSGLALCPGVSVRGCAHRPLAQHGLLYPHLQSLPRPLRKTEAPKSAAKTPFLILTRMGFAAVRSSRLCGAIVHSRTQ